MEFKLMDRTDKKALYSSILFGIVIAVLFMPQIGTTPVSGYTTHSSTHTQTIKYLWFTLYRWWTDQSWFVVDGYIFGEDASIDQRIYAPQYFYKGVQKHQVTYESPGDQYWKIATKVAFGQLFLTYYHSMTAKCYESGSVVWYDSWQ